MDSAHEFRQDLARIPQMTFGERRRVRGFFRSHVDRSGTTADVRHEAGRWLDQQGRCLVSEPE
jgi:hypothetical protein